MNRLASESKLLKLRNVRIKQFVSTANHLSIVSSSTMEHFQRRNCDKTSIVSIAYRTYNTENIKWFHNFAIKRTFAEHQSYQMFVYVLTSILKREIPRNTTIACGWGLSQTLLCQR